MNCDVFAGKTGWMLTDELNSVTMNDGPNGIRKVISATESEKAHCFPSLSTVASSFNEELMNSYGIALSAEAIKHNVDIVLGPGINIKRSPLCGRNFEYFSEDPILTGYLASAFIKGIQESGTGATVKHFALNNQENYRLVSDSICDEKTMREVYLKAFEIVIKRANPYMVMASYNRINGEYGTESMLITKILREEWGYDGVVVSDWGAVNDRVKALLHSLDLEMPGPSEVNKKLLEEAIKEKRVYEAACASKERLLALASKCKKAKKKEITSIDEINLSLATSSAVLLKNENILPLTNERIAVVGEQAKSGIFQGGGCANVNTPYEVSFISALNKEGKEYSYFSYDEVGDLSSFDCVILFLSQDRKAESEGFDRKSIYLSSLSLNALDKCKRTNSNIIAIVQAGSVVDTSFEKDVKAILYTGYAGELWGQALLLLLYGKCNPSGHLAESFPIALEENKEFGAIRTHYSEKAFFGYRGSESLRYPFGYGLSYTDFSYTNCQVKQKKECITVSVEVENIGTFNGRALLQAYQDTGEYIRLVGFKSEYVYKGKKVTISQDIPLSDLAIFSLKDGYKNPEFITLMFGSDSKTFYYKYNEKCKFSYVDKVKNLSLIEETFLRDNKLKEDPITINSPIEFLLKDEFGSTLVKTMIEKIKKMEEWKKEPDEHIKQVMQYPIRCIVGASNGRFSTSMALSLIAYLKGEISLSDSEKEKMLTFVEMY